MKWIAWIIILAVIVWGAFALFGGEQAEAGPIKIGFIGPLVGDNGAIGENAKAAVEIAVDEINADGGVDGRMIEVTYEDGGCAGSVANAAANKLINADGVHAILGAACSAETLAFTDVAESAQVPTLSYCSSAPRVSQAGDFIFRNYPSDAGQGVFAANHVYNNLGATKAAVLYRNDEWGLGVHEVFVNEFTKLGGEIVFEEAHDPAVRDLRTQLTKVKSSDAEVLYFLTFADVSIPVINQIGELGLDIPVVGGDTWDDPKIWSDTGDAGEGFQAVVIEANPTDEFKEKLAEKIGSDELIVCTPYAYDGLKMLAQVIGEVGTDGVAIKDALYDINYTGGVSNPTTRFDENGDPIGIGYVIKEVQDGVISELEAE